jgi:hypothetical protein
MYWFAVGANAARVTEEPRTTSPLTPKATIENLRRVGPMCSPDGVAAVTMWGHTVLAPHMPYKPLSDYSRAVHN